MDREPAPRKASNYTQNNTKRIKARADIHASDGNANLYSSILEGEDISFLRQNGHCDRGSVITSYTKQKGERRVSRKSSI
jgi:hypothetical protein